MKNRVYFFVLLLSIAFVSCNKTEYELYNEATPIYMSKEEFKSSVKITIPQETITSGKVYVYNNIVLINDVDKGIHIVDNTNPVKPIKIAFIEIVGNKDMEVKGDYLYADSLMDVVVFDISDLSNITEVSRIENVLQNYIVNPQVDNLVFNYDNYEEDAVIVGWDVEEKYREVEEFDGDLVFVDAISLDTSNSSTGEGGSLARFKIVNEYLYVVDNSYINIFDISNLEAPLALHDVYAGFGIETIFNRGNHLFLGSINGMYIYDITEANRPELVSEFIHATACDPVVVDGDYAYVTLRGGNSCGAFDSSLEIIDINDIQNPSLVKTYALDNPYGLGIKNELLFICDGTSGLKVYNKDNVEDLQLLKEYKNVTAYDVIPLENRLLMIGGNVLYQYNYVDNGLDLISEFSLN